MARKSSLTFMAVLAEVSIKSKPVSSAYVWASFVIQRTNKYKVNHQQSFEKIQTLNKINLKRTRVGTQTSDCTTQISELQRTASATAVCVLDSRCSESNTAREPLTQKDFSTTN